MAKSLKALVITTKSGQAAGSEYVWNKLQNPELFISDIITQEVNIENSEELNKLISGIPTPFARMAMFKYAINYVGQAEEKLTGLMSFYKTLQDEWKGLIACIALDNQPISIEKISLSYSDGKNTLDTANMYEPKGALGNMLFNDRILWCDQDEVQHAEGAKSAKPYVYVIRYNEIVIGGTSPESLLFTAPTYNIDCPKGFYSKVTRTFTDPLKATLGLEDVEKLYAYVKHISNSINKYENSFQQKPDVSKISVFLNNWLTEIKAYALRKGNTIDENAIVPNLSKFKAPFDLLFNFQTTLYGYGGRIDSDKAALNLPENLEAEAVEVELDKILLDPDTCTVAEIIFDDSTEAVNAGVHMLKATSEWGDRYFTLPLTEKGMVIFQNEIEGLLNSGSDIKSNLSAKYDVATNALKVTLQVDVKDKKSSFERVYKNPKRVEGQKVIVWPDFVSKIWDKYYLYSELPHNSDGLKAFPLRADKDEYRLLTSTVNGVYQFKKIAINGRKIDANDAAEILIEYDINKLNSADFKYEIYESADPFKGVALQFKMLPSGYLVFKGFNHKVLKDFRNDKLNLKPVRVGFDFGSNNTCISYADVGETPQLMTFKNRRRFLIGVDEKKDSKLAAAQNRVFFFQHEEIKSNQIKSMIMIHDERRVKNIRHDVTVELSKEIKGGFPVFEKNIPVEESESNTHKIRFNNQLSSIKYNMKWSNDKKEDAYKESLLRDLWLKTYAELLERERYPESLVWAYPSSMTATIINKYRILWGDIGQVNPLTNIEDAEVATPNDVLTKPANKNLKDDSSGDGWGDNESWGDDEANDKNATSTKSGVLYAQTEAESVCRHALGIGLTPGTRGLMMGFDVGGSTTDILCVALRKDNTGKPVNTLIKQSSMKFAAGKLADATRDSKRFQEILTSFCRKKGFLIHGITVPPFKLNSSTSSFYYNMIVDTLSTQEDLYEFYRNIAADCRELFIINSYMTGLIMFYAGQLAFKIKMASKSDPDYDPDFFEELRIGIFGKGGRMFDWLKAINEQFAIAYYKDCFGLGYGPAVKDDIRRFTIKSPDPEYIKAEVSFGLSRKDVLNTTGNRIKELIGEDGYKYNGKQLDSFDDVQLDFLHHFGTEFAYPREFKRFTEFVMKFYSFTKDRFGFNFPNIQHEINEMNIISYVNNIQEYKIALENDEFDFEAPVIILEGMCFLDEVLLKKVFK